MKKLNKNFNFVSNTVEAMAFNCNGLCTCSCGVGTYCQCNTISDYGGYQYLPNTSDMTASNAYTNVQYSGIV